ncbi:hypothetical protein RDABS01_011842 [Bienertia sinuspersici]
MSVIWSSLSLHSLTSTPSSKPFSLISNPSLSPSSNSPKHLLIRCAKRSKRTGKLRYPSEKRKLKQLHKLNLDVKDKCEGVWRLSKLNVDVENDPGKDSLGVSDALLQQIAKVLEFPVSSLLPAEAFTVVRKSFDARKFLKTPKFVYTVDMDVDKLLDLEPRLWDFISEIEPKVGLIEHMPEVKAIGDLFSLVNDSKKDLEGGVAGEAGSSYNTPSHRPKVAVVGSGPAGLFAALVLGELGADVTLIERGQPVEQRGRDIGALVVRRIIQSESNFCFGEGGAGTWSDGKLVTRIGKNSDSVQAVLRTLVHFGAPRSILVDGKPHLGTDRLVPLLRNFRQHLQSLGVSIKFGTRVDDLLVEGATVKGVKVSDVTRDSPIHSHELSYDAVVLAVGHSARDVYQMLLSHNVDLVPKDFAYAELAAEVQGGRGKVPVADYKIANYLSGEGAKTSYASASRGCYSFCMCPGGQVVLTSTNPSELCINGMSFSRRSSKWANSALVVTVSSKDFESLNFHGALAGVSFQTRTSSPVQIPRDSTTFENTTLKGLYPVGEGAGFAGGIVSAAVDGLYAGFAVAKNLGLITADIESLLGKAQSSGITKY